MNNLDVSWNNLSFSRIGSSKVFPQHFTVMDAVSLQSGKPFQRKTDLKINLLHRRKKTEKFNRNQFTYISPKHSQNNDNDSINCQESFIGQSFLKSQTDREISPSKQLLKQLSNPQLMTKKCTNSAGFLKSKEIDKTRCTEKQKSIQIKMLELEKTNKTFREENYKLKLKLNKLQINHNLTLNQIKHKNSEIQTLKLNLEQQRRKNSESKKTIFSMETDLKTLNTKIKRLIYENQRLQGQHLKQALNAKQQELFKVKLQMYEYQKIAQYKSLEVDTIRKKFHDVTQQSTSLSKQLSTSKKQNEEMKTKIQKLQHFKHKIINNQHDRKNRFCDEQGRDHEVILELTPEK